MPSSWSLHGPEGEDWRVPVAELTDRQHALAEELRARGLGGALVQHPVDLYYLAGGRQNGVLWIPASEDGASIQFVRRSLDRARFEAGGSDAPHEVRPMPRSSEFEDVLMASEQGERSPSNTGRCLPRTSPGGQGPSEVSAPLLMRHLLSIPSGRSRADGNWSRWRPPQ